MVGGLFGGKAIAIGVAEAHFQAVAHPVAGALGHRTCCCSSAFCSAVSLLYEGTLYHFDVYSTAAPTGRSSAKLRVADVQR